MIALGFVLLLNGCGDDDSKAEEPSNSPSAAPSVEPRTLAESASEVRDGVVRIEITRCDGEVGSGSGFFIAPGLVATVAHVVDGARTVSLRTTTDVSRGVVEHSDLQRELAVIRTVRPMTGHSFDFSATQPRELDHVAVIGYPLGMPLAVNEGQVNGLQRRIELERQSLEGLIQTDASINPGNSGGPMINEEGEVVGLVEAQRRDGQGVAYAIPGTRADKVIENWLLSAPKQEMPDCGPTWGSLMRNESRHPDAPAIASSLYRYYSSINDEFYEESFGLLTGNLRGTFEDFDDFVEQYSTTTISDAVVELADMTSETTDTADVRFVSRQDPEFSARNEDCTRWHLRYTMRIDQGFWSIDRAQNLPGSPASC